MSKTAAARARNGNGRVELKERVSIATVTPKQAQEWLEGNVDNRKLREARVVQLSRVLERGEWELTGDAIVFDEYGTLLNGQHRLSAVVVTGISARFVILRGVPAKAQEVMDQGLARSLGDQLMRRGIPYYGNVSGALFWLHRLNYAEATGVAHYAEPALRPSLRQLLALYDQNPELAQEAPLIQPINRILKVRFGATLALYHRLLQIEDDNIETEVNMFLDQWTHGTNLKADDSVSRLRNFCIEDASKRHTKGRAPDYRFMAYAIIAWNKWRDGEPIKQLKWTYTPSNRMAWPVPH